MEDNWLDNKKEILEVISRNEPVHILYQRSVDKSFLRKFRYIINIVYYQDYERISHITNGLVILVLNGEYLDYHKEDYNYNYNYIYRLQSYCERRKIPFYITISADEALYMPEQNRPSFQMLYNKFGHHFVEQNNLLSLLYKCDHETGGLYMPKIDIRHTTLPDYSSIHPSEQQDNKSESQNVIENDVENTYYDDEFKKLVSENTDSKCFASTFAPAKIKVGDSMLVQVYIYKKDNHNLIVKLAKQTDDNKTKERQMVLLNYNIHKDDKIDVTINIYNLVDKSETKTAIWMENYAKACFNVNIPTDFKQSKVYAEVLISINKAFVCKMDFATKVRQKNIFARICDYINRICTKRLLAQITSHCFKKVFISYSHKDTGKINFIAEAYKALGIDYFYDTDNLRGGDVFAEEIENYIKTADLFVLCWSENAAQSSYIQKEINTALPLVYPQVKPQEKAQLSIYPISFEPYAPYPENMKHIYHFSKI